MYKEPTIYVLEAQAKIDLLHNTYSRPPIYLINRFWNWWCIFYNLSAWRFVRAGHFGFKSCSEFRAFEHLWFCIIFKECYGREASDRQQYFSLWKLMDYEKAASFCSWTYVTNFPCTIYPRFLFRFLESQKHWTSRCERIGEVDG